MHASFQIVSQTATDACIQSHREGDQGGYLSRAPNQLGPQFENLPKIERGLFKIGGKCKTIRAPFRGIPGALGFFLKIMLVKVNISCLIMYYVSCKKTFLMNFQSNHDRSNFLSIVHKT